MLVPEANVRLVVIVNCAVVVSEQVPSSKITCTVTGMIPAEFTIVAGVVPAIVVADVTWPIAVSNDCEPPCQMLRPAVVNRTSATCPTVPNERPESAFTMNASPPATANMLLFGNEATGSAGFWMPPGDAVASSGALNVQKVGPVTEHEPPG